MTCLSIKLFKKTLTLEDENIINVQIDMFVLYFHIVNLYFQGRVKMTRHIFRLKSHLVFDLFLTNPSMMMFLMSSG